MSKRYRAYVVVESGPDTTYPIKISVSYDDEETVEIDAPCLELAQKIMEHSKGVTEEFFSDSGIEVVIKAYDAETNEELAEGEEELEVDPQRNTKH